MVAETENETVMRRGQHCVDRFFCEFGSQTGSGLDGRETIAKGFVFVVSFSFSTSFSLIGVWVLTLSVNTIQLRNGSLYLLIYDPFFRLNEWIDKASWALVIRFEGTHVRMIFMVGWVRDRLRMNGKIFTILVFLLDLYSF